MWKSGEIQVVLRSTPGWLRRSTWSLAELASEWEGL